MSKGECGSIITVLNLRVILVYSENGSHLILLTATLWPMLPIPQGTMAMSTCHTPSTLIAAKLSCVNFTHVKCCTDTYTSLLFNTNIIILFKRN